MRLPFAPYSTAKRLYSKAQGRAAHPGMRSTRTRHPEGVQRPTEGLPGSHPEGVTAISPGSRSETRGTRVEIALTSKGSQTGRAATPSGSECTSSLDTGGGVADALQPPANCWHPGMDPEGARERNPLGDYGVRG